MKKNFRFLSLFLALILVISAFSFDTAYAVESTENITQELAPQEQEEFVLPDIVEEAEAIERGYIGRAKDEEKDNFTFVFKNSDNTRTMRVYSHPVKYTDKDGNVKDITLDIQSRTGGGFETKDNSIKTTFGAKLSEGIRLQHENVDIKLIPANKNITPVLSEDNKTVTYTLDTKTSLEYSLTYTGFKEDIVVSEYTGQTEYEFLLYTNGLTVKEEMGSYYLADSEGNRKANIGDIIIFTADERNNTFGELSCEEIKPNYAYLLTIHVDAEYLKDEKTVYPIRIDPTLEITSADPEGAIEDVTVYTGTSYYSGTSGVLYLGTSNNLTYRILMKFPNLDLTGITAAQITNATVEFRDLMCQSVQVAMECRYFTGAANMWSESSVNYWASICGDSYVGSLIDTKTIYYGNGNEGSDIQRYSFNITNAAKSWADGVYSPQQGFIFKAADESFSSTEDRLKYFGSYNRSDYRTSFTLQYTDELETPDPTTIALSQTVIRAEKGDYIHLQATVTPDNDKTIQWSSSDTSIATVTSYGVVYVKSLGVVTITVTVPDESYNSITASCVIHCCIPDGEYYIKNASSEQYADVKDYVMSWGTRIVQNPLSEFNTQKWKIAYNISAGCYTIVSNRSTIDSDNSVIEYYMSVTSEMTSNNAPISLRTGSLTDGMRWSIKESSSGNYIFTPKTGESSNKVLKLYNNSITAGALLEQYTYIEDDDFSDEWILEPLIDYSLMFLGAYAGDDRIPPILTSITQELDYSGFVGNGCTNLNTDDLLIELAKSKTFACITHGDRVSIQTSDSSLSVQSLMSYNTGNFDNLEFVYFGACWTGQFYDTEFPTHNLVYTMHYYGGADTVIGFVTDVNIEETYYWTEHFMLDLASGATVDEAFDAADLAVLQNSSFLASSLSTTEQDRYVLGSTSVIPFD